MFQNAIIAGAYFYFHYRYIALVSTTLQRPYMAKVHVAGTFLLNYALFIACSILELNLLLNWGLFFLFLLGETVVYCKSGWRTALFFSLTGILYGLSINIFCRCVVAIATGEPLHAFDNNISSVGNLKPAPIFLGFLLGGLVLHLMARAKPVQQLRTLIGHPEHLAFQLELMGGMFLYLFLNLLLYQSRGNGILLKLWGIKSCVFSLAGFYLGLRYSLKMCRLSDYREQNRAIQRELIQREQTEARLRTVAYQDALTGAFNRQYACQRLEELLRQGTRFTLCFLDLDDLKGVNDRFGHAEGDHYLITAARELAGICREGSDLLARYGGDEFLLLFPGAAAAVVEERLGQVDQRLRKMGGSQEFPFSMSISYGAVESSDGADANALLAAADEAMYRRKRAREARDP